MNRTKWFWGNFFAFFLLLATPYAHGVKIYGMFFETANLLALALFAAVALVLACITMAVSNRIVLISICCCLVVLFVDFMSDILEPALQLENTGTWGIIGFAAFAAALAGLFTAMWFLAGNLTVVIISTCGAILASTIVMAGFTVFSSSPGTWSKPQAASASAEKLPVYIHLILDEQTGLAALDKTIPPQARLRADIQEFFTGNGFRIFPHAYAQYFQTLETIPAMLNFAAPANVNPLIQENKSGGTNAINAIRFTLAKNSYFDALMKQGYRLHVYQSNWLGFCGPYASTISSCNTYPYIVSQLSLARYPFMERAYILYRLYLSQSLFARMSYRALVAAGDGSVGKGFLYRANWSKLPGPPVALPVFDTMLRDISRAKNGDLFFAHLLMPHHPYSVDAQCENRQPLIDSWLDFNKPVSPHAPLVYNTAESRLERYGLYMGQVRCVLKKLEQLVAMLKQKGLYENAVIIINGDHGSRIVINKPMADNIRDLTPQDFADTFSALYAVKMPGLSAGTDNAMISLSRLFKLTIGGAADLGGPLQDDANPVVYLHGRTTEEAGGPMIAAPIPPMP